MVDGRGAVRAGAGIATFASGWLVPLSFLPHGLGTTLRWLPFAGMVQAPIDVLLARQPAGPTLARQVMWCAVLLWAGRALLRRAQRRLVVQGG
jgi:ABC-2 type transport system permease protein